MRSCGDQGSHSYDSASAQFDPHFQFFEYGAKIGQGRRFRRAKREMDSSRNQNEGSVDQATKTGSELVGCNL
jgi:hypothetical protein